MVDKQEKIAKVRKPMKPRIKAKKAKPWEAKVSSAFIMLTLGLIVAYFVQSYIHINETNPVTVVFEKITKNNKPLK